MLEAAIQARDETARQVARIKAEQEQAAKSPYAGVTPEEYRQYKRDVRGLSPSGSTQQRMQDIARLEQELQDAIALRTSKGLSDPRVARDTQDKIDKTMERLQQYKDLAQYIADADAKVEAIEAYYRSSNPLVHYDQDNAGSMQMTEDISMPSRTKIRVRRPARSASKLPRTSSSWTRPTSPPNSSSCSTSGRINARGGCHRRRQGGPGQRRGCR